MLDVGKSSDNPAKKPSMTPKAIINQKFGNKAHYKIEEVRDLTQIVCPGLAISQNVPCLFRCTLELPTAVVVSDTFKRKKDAEQSAAEKAIEKLCILQKEYHPTIQEAWVHLIQRLDILFGNEFLSSSHPLSGHFRAALRKESQLNGCVPVSVVALYDAKICNICKYIDQAAESSSLLVMSLVLKAAKQSNLILSFDEQLLLQRRNPYPAGIIPSLENHESSLCEEKLIEMIRIPASPEKDVESLKISIAANCYYLDIIGRELGVEASKVMISRTIGKASSDLRIYFSVTPVWQHCSHLSEPIAKHTGVLKGSLNETASYFYGQDIY